MIAVARKGDWPIKRETYSSFECRLLGQLIDECERRTHGSRIMSSNRVVLTTGANSGIGYEAAKALLQSQKSY